MKIPESPDTQQMSSNHCRQSCSTVWLKKPPNSTQKLLHRELQLKAKGPRRGKPLRKHMSVHKDLLQVSKGNNVLTEWLLNKILQLLTEELCPKTSTCRWAFSALFEGMLAIRTTVFLESESLKLSVLLNQFFIPCRTTQVQEQWESNNCTSQMVD